jgi:hypothetical protein
MSKVAVVCKKSSNTHGYVKTHIIQGNAFKMPLEDESVQCVVTSPPYFNLRKYKGGDENSFGQEKTIPEYVHHTIENIEGSKESASS